MAAITYTSGGQINENIKLKILTASVTATTDTITIEDMNSIVFCHAVVSGTEATALDVTLSTNTITTAGHTSGTETWILLVIGT